jgi:hypothetical protein
VWEYAGKGIQQVEEKIKMIRDEAFTPRKGREEGRKADDK